MQTTASARIGEHSYQVQQLPAMRAHKLLLRIGKIAGPALGELVGQVAGAGGADLKALTQEDLRAILGGLPGALRLLFDRCSERDLEEITLELLEGALCDEKPLRPQFDLVFRGDVLAIYEVLTLAFSCNYGSFSRALGTLGTAFRGRRAPASEPSSTSAGQPSASSSQG